MKRKLIWAAVVLFFLLPACSQEEPQMVDVTRVVSEAMEMSEEIAVQGTSVPQAGVGEPADTGIDTLGRQVGEAAAVAQANRSQQQTAQRLIVKNGEMLLETDTAGEAVSAVSNLAAATGGYIINQRVWEQGEFTYATLTIGVPVTEFERAMNQIRQLGDIKQDIATGEDVTDEFVDLEARLETLEITRGRLQEFLANANKMDNIIKLNKELTQVEEQINTIRGRMNYLANRSAFSTITVQINPIIPEATPTPIPDPEPWTLVNTATRATRQLQSTTRSVADVVVYFGIVCGPWFLLLWAAVYIGLKVWLRINNRPLQTAAPQPADVHTPSSQPSDEN